MKPTPSPLNIIDFAVLRMEYAYIPSLNKGEDTRMHFGSYDLDVDFRMHKNDVLQVFMQCSVNRSEKKLPGYSMFVEVACLFNFNKDIVITPEQKNSIEGFSTVYIALNALRGFVATFTSSGPVGRYILPSIDLNELISQKKTQLKQKTSIETQKAPVPKEKTKIMKKQT